jgi:polyhydroxyalkanoate synthesis regulator phasin
MPAMSPEQEKTMLQQEAHSLRDALSALEKRISELEDNESGS